MAMNELNFSDDFDFLVDVYIDDVFLAKGQLVFRCNHSPYLSLDDKNWNHVLNSNKKKTITQIQK